MPGVAGSVETITPKRSDRVEGTFEPLLLYSHNAITIKVPLTPFAVPDSYKQAIQPVKHQVYVRSLPNKTNTS